MQKEVKIHGRQVIFPHDKLTQKQNFSDQMKAKVDSPSGRREYSKRLGTIDVELKGGVKRAL